MKTRLALAFTFSLLIVLSGCISGITVKGDGNLITEKINITDYDRIELNGSNMIVNYEQSTEQPSLTVTTDKNIFDLYDFAVESGLLIIKPKKTERWTNFQPTEFTVTTNSTTIKKLSAGGTATVNINSPIETENLEIDLAGSGLANMPELVKVNSFKTELAGSGTINAANLCVNVFESEIAGSGTLILKGEAEKLNISIAGSGKVQAFDLQAKELSCSVAGSGNVQVNVSDKISADIAGSGNILYKGNPTTIKKDVAGSGSIKPAE